MEKVKLRQAAYRLGSLETFMRMVESGNGVTFIPELATYQLSEQQKELVRPFATPNRHVNRLGTRKDFIRLGRRYSDRKHPKICSKRNAYAQAGLRVV